MKLEYLKNAKAHQVTVRANFTGQLNADILPSHKLHSNLHLFCFTLIAFLDKMKVLSLALTSITSYTLCICFNVLNSTTAVV